MDHSAVDFIEPLRQYFRKKGVEAENLVLSHCSAAFKTGTYKAGIEPYLDLTIDDEPCDALKQVQLIDNWIDKLSTHGK